MANTKLVKDAESGKLLAYIGRNGDTFPLQDNTYHVFIDDLGGTHPYAVLFIQNNEIVESGCITKENFEKEKVKLKQEGISIVRAAVNESGELELLN